jgi:hypothetical protein
MTIIDESVTGIPLGLSYWDFNNVDLCMTLAITLDVGGNIIVGASRVERRIISYQRPLYSAHMISMVEAAITRGAKITLTGKTQRTSIPDTIYPNGFFTIYTIEVFGYKWGKKYLT